MATPRIPTRGTRFIDPEAERIRGRSALEALRGYAGAPSQSSAMYPGSQEAYESGELAGMAEMLIPGAAMAKGALGAALAGVIKPRGGNWLESGLLPVLHDLKRHAPSPAYDMYGNEVANPLANSPMYRTNAVINRWIEGPLTKYLKRDIGTEQDPVRRLFDEGVHHVPPDSLMDYRDMADADLALKRQMLDQPREPLSSGQGRYWENLTDEMIVGGPAREYMTDVSPAWMQKDPTAMVYHFGGPTWSRTFPESVLGFRHITDELDNSLMGEAGGLPRKFWLTPEKMEQMGMEKAVRHVDAINKWRAEQKIAANQELASKALAVREYPDTPELPNPKGLRWVELKAKDVNPPDGYEYDKRTGMYIDPWDEASQPWTPKQDRKAAKKELEKQLKYEGDVMGHCVGGYCDEVLEGNSRIFSLRDAKGEPHVTVEVKPQGAVFSDVAKYLGEEEVDRLLDQGVTLSEMIEKIPNFERPMKIQQIKGKQNRRPKDEYLPFVQDFVRNPPTGGRWADVRDFENTGLARFTGDLEVAHQGGRFTIPQGDYTRAELEKMAREAGMSDDEIPGLLGRYKFAEGGAVRAPAGNWRRMDLGGTIGYLMEG